MLYSLSIPTTSTIYGTDLTRVSFHITVEQHPSVFLFWLCNVSERSYNADDTTTLFKPPKSGLTINRKM